MNAIPFRGEDFACSPNADMAEGDQTVALDIGNAPCYAYGAKHHEISSKSGWGGPRPNSGGARENSGGARPGAGRKPKAPAMPVSLGLRWFVIETHPSAERQVAYDLARHGWRGYLPQIATRKRDRVMPTMFHKVVLPMFRGYVFVEFDRDGRTWGSIITMCPGVRGFIKAAGTGIPLPAPHGFVERLMEGDAERLHLALIQNPPRLVGSRVQIAVGPMASFYGMVMSCDGITTIVNVDLFGRLVPIEMGWDQVEPVT